MREVAGRRNSITYIPPKEYRVIRVCARRCTANARLNPGTGTGCQNDTREKV